MLDTRELARRPGSSRTVSRRVSAPADLGIAVLGVPEGSPIELSVLLESVLEGVLASGTARARLTGGCARCLAEITDELAVDFQELYVYPESGAADDEVCRLADELLDLEPALRDAVVLALPFRPVCQADCPGLCPECGERLADDLRHAHPERIDSRWEALSVLAVDETAGARGTGPSKE